MINIRNIATYVPNNYLNLNNRFINIKKNFLTSKIGAIKVSRMKKNENVVVWFFNKKNNEFDETDSFIFFNYFLLKKLNKYGPALSSYNFYRVLISPFTNILSPIVYFVIPYLILRFKY